MNTDSRDYKTVKELIAKVQSLQYEIENLNDDLDTDLNQDTLDGLGSTLDEMVDDLYSLTD